MPAALDVDREQVRMLVLSLGVREAARKMGLAEGTVQWWSAQGKWLAPTRSNPAIMPQPGNVGRPTNPTKPVDILAEALLNDGNATRLAGMKAARRVAERIAEMPIDEAVEQMPNLKAGLQSAALAGSWQDGKSEAQVSLQFFSITQERAETGQNESPERHIYDIPGESSGAEPETTDVVDNDPMF